MMKKILLSAVTAALIMTASAGQASWFGGNDSPWGGNGYGNNWNPYDEWDPRYWIREMDNEMSDDDDYGPPPGYGGYGPGYGPGYGGGYGPGYGYGGPAPYYGPQQGYAPQQQAPQYAPQQAPQGYAPQGYAPQGYAPQR